MNILTIFKSYALFEEHLNCVLKKFIFCLLIVFITICYSIVYNFIKLIKLLQILQCLSQKNVEAAKKLSEYQSAYTTNEITLSLIEEKLESSSFFCSESLMDGAFFVGIVAIALLIFKGTLNACSFDIKMIIKCGNPFTILLLFEFFYLYFKNNFLIFFYKHTFSFLCLI